MSCSLYYDDVYLIPKYSDLESRSLADTSVVLGNRKFSLPIVPSNMKSTIDETWAKWLSDNNYFYVMHRFDEVNVPFVKLANEQSWKLISISVGVNEDSYNELKEIKNSNLRLDYVTIDVAHGHHKKVENMIKFIKNNFPNTFVIAGNFASIEGVMNAEYWGADATKCLIGTGLACSTKFQTGFHVPSFSCILQCAYAASKPVIADGGAKHYGDIAKALVAGASMVMAGGMFASCKDSPTVSLDINGSKKIYYGNASRRAKGHSKNVEGFELVIDSCDLTLEERLNEIKQALQSSISYGGGKDLSCFKSVKYIRLR